MGLLSLNGGGVSPDIFRMPIGSVVGWLKSLTGTPTLPEEWAECNGQTINDEESVYDGVTLPDLNGKYLKGSNTSGATGGSTTHKHLTPLASTSASNGAYQYDNPFGTGSDSSRVYRKSSYSSYDTSSTYLNTSDNTTTAEPPYYAVVWVIKIK